MLCHCLKTCSYMPESFANHFSFAVSKSTTTPSPTAAAAATAVQGNRVRGTNRTRGNIASEKVWHAHNMTIELACIFVRSVVLW